MVNNNLKSIKMKLPEEYVVTNVTGRQAQEILNLFYNTKYNSLFSWNYIICSHSLDNLGYSTRNDQLFSEWKHLPQFTYEQWKEAISQPAVPEKWCVRMNDQLVIDWLNKNENKYTHFVLTETLFAHVPMINKTTCFPKIQEGYTEITINQFKELILKQEIMKAQTFAITGSEELLEAMWKRLGALGYNTEYNRGECRINHISQGMRTKNPSLAVFKELYIGDAAYRTVKEDYGVVFNLPEQYNEALVHAEEMLKDKYWEEEKKLELPFGETMWTIDKEDRSISTEEYGTITLAEIEAVKEWLADGPDLLGYEADANNEENIVAFGCQSGTVAQMNAIIDALES